MVSAVLKACLVLGVLATVTVYSLPSGHHGKHIDYYAVPKYKFTYGVNDHYTGDIKSATESRDGDLTRGSYSLVQPDGVLRTVNYVADPWNGFQAVVHNNGHPEPKGHP